MSLFNNTYIPNYNCNQKNVFYLYSTKNQDEEGDRKKPKYNVYDGQLGRHSIAKTCQYFINDLID